MAHLMFGCLTSEILGSHLALIIDFFFRTYPFRPLNVWYWNVSVFHKSVWLSVSKMQRPASYRSCNKESSSRHYSLLNDPPPLIPISRLLHPLIPILLRSVITSTSHYHFICYFLHFAWLHHCSYIPCSHYYILYHSPLRFSRSSSIYPSCTRLILGYLNSNCFTGSVC